MDATRLQGAMVHKTASALVNLPCLSLCGKNPQNQNLHINLFLIKPINDSRYFSLMEIR